MFFRMKYNEETTLENIYSFKENSFNIIRLFLAVAVIYSHCYPLLQGGVENDILTRLTKGQITFGSFSVYCFFIISGFLITQSMINSKSHIEYLMKRVLRIFPAFFVSLFLCAFVVGPLVSNIPLKDYFGGGNIIYPIDFIFKNITMNISGYSWGFLDVFANNPFAGSVNGSMWTLKHEFACYLLVMILSVFFIFRRRILLFYVTLISVVLAILNLQGGFKLFELGNNAWILSGAEYNSFIIFVSYFLMGALMYIYRDKVIINFRYIVLCSLLLIFFTKTNNLKLAMLIILPYLLISLCVITNVKGITKYGDFSYGLYIYAFPIQQILVRYFKDNLNIFSFFIFSTVLTFIIAIISWFFIEKPMLKVKKRLGK